MRKYTKKVISECICYENDNGVALGMKIIYFRDCRIDVIFDASDGSV